jgi:hypothetical protein
MIVRGVTRAEVTEVLANPEVTYQSGVHPNANVIWGSTAAGRQLKLVIAGATVVTVGTREEPMY